MSYTEEETSEELQGTLEIWMFLKMLQTEYAKTETLLPKFPEEKHSGRGKREEKFFRD